VSASLFAAACQAPAPILTAPDILLIVIDCLRSDHVGAYGHFRPTTPNLDALAGEGTLFRHAFAQSHWTRPSVPSYLTGLYPSEHGLLEVELNDSGVITGPALSAEVVTIAEQLKDAGYITAMLGEQYQLARIFNLDQGFDFYRNRSGQASLIGRNFLGWLSRHEGEGQFFGYLHYLDIHWPYCPPKRFLDRFDTGESTLSLCYQWRRLRRELRSGERQLTPADVERLSARYDEELAAVDASLGTLFQGLRERGQWDETLIIVTADHGEEFMERGLMGHQGGLSDVLLSVPLIIKPPVSWPGEPMGEVEDLVELRSIVSTLREAAGAARGAGGPSLVPYLLGRQAPDPLIYVVAESTLAVMVRSAGYSLLVSKEDGSSQLFDRTAEPFETTDVAGREPEITAELTRHLRAWSRALAPIEPMRIAADDDITEGLKDLGYID
jgi:arylsulfatase A-like enzyme